MDDELIDFTCGDWPTLDPRAELGETGLGPVQWQSPPPTFVWATRGLFDDWQPHGEPDIGELWYGPWSGSRAEHVNDTLTLVWPLGPKSNLARMKLPERVQAIV